MPWKDKQCSIPINEVISGKSLQWGGVGLVLSQNKRPYNLETFKFNHKKFGTQSDTSLLIIVEFFLVCHPKMGKFLAGK